MTDRNIQGEPTELGANALEDSVGGGHSGGANILLGDGSVRFLRTTSGSDDDNVARDLAALNLQR